MTLWPSDRKSVNGTQIFHWEVSIGKTGLPFQEFRLFRKISSGTNQKVVFHLQPSPDPELSFLLGREETRVQGLDYLQPDRNFRNFLVNGKRSMSNHR